MVPSWRRGQGQTHNKRMSLRTSRASSETWEEDLNQRFLALRSPPVRSHCAASVTVTRAADLRLLPQVFEETNAPVSSVPALHRSTCPQPLPHQLWIPSAIQVQNHVASSSPSSWLTISCQVGSPDYRCQFILPPFHPQPLLFLSLLLQDFTRKFPRLVLSGDFRSIYLSVSFLCR